MTKKPTKYAVINGVLCGIEPPSEAHGVNRDDLWTQLNHEVNYRAASRTTRAAWTREKREVTKRIADIKHALALAEETLARANEALAKIRKENKA